MKATGIVRNLDPLGRIVLPKELRRTLNLEDGTPLEIFMSEDGGDRPPQACSWLQLLRPHGQP